MEVTVLDRQRKSKIATAPLGAFVRRLAREAPAAGEGTVTVCLVSDRAMQALNRRYRGRDEPTDVLAFPAGAREGPGGSIELGDVVVAVPTALRQAAERRHSLAREIRILVLHGWLHLLGHDHERDDGAMLRLQERLERRLLSRKRGRRGK